MRIQSSEFRVKNLILVISLFIILNSTFTTLAYAHVLKTDGSIGAVLHVDPADDPIAKEQTNFFFEFKDTKNKFDPKNCDCRVSIYKSNQEIYSANLFQNTSDPTLSDAVFSYVFPEKNIYQVKVVGQPKTPNSFQNFSLEYTVRVAREGDQVNLANQNSRQQSWISTHYPHLIIGGVIILALVLALFKQGSTKKR